MDVMERRRVILAQATEAPPAGYTWIEYAMSTASNSYVDLPIVFERDDTVEFRMSIDKSGQTKTGDVYMVSPNTWNNNGNRYSMGYHGSEQRYTMGFGSVSTSNNYLYPQISSDGEIHTWFYKDGIVSIPELNIALDLTHKTFGGATTELRLFYGYNTPTNGKIVYYKHKKTNGTQVYIRPVQNIQTGIVEMYDLISKTIMTRTGTLSAPID